MVGQVLECGPGSLLWVHGRSVTLWFQRESHVSRETVARGVLVLTAMPAPTLGALLLPHDHESTLYGKKIKTLKEGWGTYPPGPGTLGVFVW